MLKPFCDICDEPITNGNNRGLDEEKPYIVVGISDKISLSVQIKSEGVHVCKYCIAKSISDVLDDRPRPA